MKQYFVVGVVLTLVACATSQRLFLEQFYSATGGPNWNQNAVWLLENVSTCSWFGISCDAQGNITAIILPNNNLRGAVEGLDFSAAPSITRIDLSGNHLFGRVPTTLFYLPLISLIALQQNSFTKLQFSSMQQQLSLSPSLLSVQLSGNRFFCPLSAYVRAFVLPLTIDSSSFRCIRTMTMSRHVSPTLLLEPPVGIRSSAYSGDVSYILLSTSAFNVTSQWYLNRVTSVLFGILNRTILNELTLPALNTNVSSDNEYFSVSLAQWNDNSYVNISFGVNSNSTNEEKWSIVARLQSNHVSVVSLAPSAIVVVKVGGQLPPSSTTSAPPMIIGGITTTSEIVFICIGASVLVFVVVAALCIRFMTRHPFSEIIQPKIQVLP